MSKLVDQLTTLVGANGIISGPNLAERATSYWDPSPTSAKCLLLPQSTEAVSAVLRLCHSAGQSVVVQGGLTGVVQGADATDDDVIISLQRMNAIESVDSIDGVAVIQAGAVLQMVQESLADEGFLFPLDLGARGSCTIGGAVSTNAGGVNVLRYGMIRNQILGLEAVLADGRVISSMNQMLKNNTGYDIKQLFIGSEGTLGVVTRAVFKLHPLPKSRQTVLLATQSFEAITGLLNSMRSRLAGTLSAFEVMWSNHYCAVTAAGGHAAPLARDYPYYVLAEAEGADDAEDAKRFESLLEDGLDSGDIVDAVIPKSQAEREAIWTIREDFDAVLPAYLYDISMPMKSMAHYVERLQVALADWREDAECTVFGHIADGNLHIFVKPFEDGQHHDKADRIVYGCLDGLQGSISAEHGIGIEKKAWLASTRSDAEIQIMRGLKKLLDPANLLNPGKVLD